MSGAILDVTIANEKRELHDKLRAIAPIYAHLKNFESGYNQIMKAFGLIGCVTCRSYTYDEFEAALDHFEIGAELLEDDLMKSVPLKELNRFSMLLSLKLNTGANIKA